jgi:ABC-type antimicrobial peptide transport system permease subunit
VFVAAGLFAGTAVAALTARGLRSMLFGLQPDDPATLLAAVVVLSTAALAASYFPARRASQVDPMVALRAE